ncbi:MAG: DUF2911 domain-containing protein [Bacteroidota bacterium]
MQKTIYKSFILLAIACLSVNYITFGQLTTTPNGGNFKAAVTEQIGLTQVTVNYSRPGVKGREGKIFGTQIAHFGFINQGFGPSKSAPWRAGANENTTLSISQDVKVEGQTVPAGKYGLFLALSENEVTVILSKNSDSWGSYYYDQSEDALRVTVKQIKNQPLVERLKYEFSDQTESSAILSMLWEHWRVPIKIEVDLEKQQLQSFRNEIRTDKGFSSLAFQQAAQYCLDKNINMEEGLKWADQAINETFIGQKTFGTLSLKSRFLDKLGKKEEAANVMQQAVAIGNAAELHAYGRQLLQAQKLSEALEVFKLNESKNPTEYAPKVGMARVLSAMGKYKDALKYAKSAQTIVGENAQEKANIEGIIKKLTEGKDVN